MNHLLTMTLSSVFQRANNTDGRYRLWVQDGDPSQNSARAKRAMSRANAVLLSIPARSPDINRIENIFRLVSKKTILSMDKRMTSIIKRNGAVG